MKETAVVILNWNGKHFLEKFLENVVSNSPEADVIVIDNASTDDSLSYINTHFSQIKTVLLDKNYGFCGGYNKGLELLNHKYFILLNSDIEVTPNWIEPLIKILKSDENVATVQPKILSYHEKEYFEHAGAAGGFIDKFGYPFCRGRIFMSLEKDLQQYDNITQIFWATGACMAVRADLFKSSGGFDEDFFAHMEEIDLCWRLQNQGFKIMFTPESKIYHVGGGTLPKSNPRKTYLNFRNGLFLLHKNLPSQKLFTTIFIRLILDGIAALRFITEGKTTDFWAVFKAHISYYRKMTTLNKKRKENRANKLHQTIYNKSLIYNYFILKKSNFSDLRF